VNRISSEIQSWIRPDEMALVRRIKDFVSQVMTHHKWYVTDFLTPREQLILTSTLKQDGAVVEFYGGYPDAERKRSIIMPDNWYPARHDYHVARLKMEARTNVSHGAILGSLLGLGMERRVVGDIVFAEDGIYIFTTSNIATFVRESLVQVGKNPVHLEIDDSEREIQMIKRDLIEKTIFVQSLRADAVIAQSCSLSRSSAQNCITKGLVSLNFTPLSKTDTILYPGDILSIRHFGRVKLKEVMGTTKKDRIRAVVGVIKSSS
jgi:RNA-binding protein YlmH